MVIIRILIALFFLCNIAYAEIRQTNKLSAIKQEVLSSSPKDTLVLFDVDFVLIMPSEQVFIKHADRESTDFLKQASDNLEKIYGKQASDDLHSIILLAGTTKTVTADTAAVINELDRNGYKMLGLTLSGTGPFGKIQSMEKWRIDELKSLGINFNKNFPNVYAGELDKYLDNDIVKYNTNHDCSAGVADGIIFTCYYSKGAVLDAYLRVANYKPKKIVFVDDKIYNLQTVAEYCAREGIEYVGFEYTFVPEHAKTLKFEPQVAKLQFSLLEHTNIWIDDEQARNILIALDGKT